MYQIATAYDTLPYRGHSLKEIEKSLAMIAATEATKNVEFRNFQEMNKPKFVMLVCGDSPHVLTTPQFVHPVPVVDAVSGKVQMAVDVRTVVGFDMRQQGYFVKRMEDTQFRIEYAQLAYLWYINKNRRELSISNAYSALYGNWLRDVINRRLAVTPAEQLQIAILGALFFESQFFNGTERELTDREVNGIVSVVHRGLNVQATEVYKLIEQAEIQLPIANLADFAQLLERATGNVRLREVGPEVIITLVERTTSVENANELCAAALEYPPAFMALVNRHLRDRMLKNTTLGRHVDRIPQQAQHQMLRAVVQHIEQADD